jgi:enediyne biosynthesis protein E4
VGSKANRDGIGATVTVKTSKGAKQDQMVRTGSSYASQSELPLVFGLGTPDETLTLTVEITWPGGQKDSVSNIKPNQSIVIQEGKGVTASSPIVFVPVPTASPSPSPSASH